MLFKNPNTIQMSLKKDTDNNCFKVYSTANDEEQELEQLEEMLEGDGENEEGDGSPEGELSGLNDDGDDDDDDN